jgi:hypothetical protein
MMPVEYFSFKAVGESHSVECQLVRETHMSRRYPSCPFGRFRGSLKALNTQTLAYRVKSQVAPSSTLAVLRLRGDRAFGIPDCASPGRGCKRPGKGNFLQNTGYSECARVCLCLLSLTERQDILRWAEWDPLTLSPFRETGNRT